MALGLLHLLALLTGDDDFVSVFPVIIVGFSLLSAFALAAPRHIWWVWDGDGYSVHPNPAPRRALMALAFGVPSMVWVVSLLFVPAYGDSGDTDAGHQVSPAISGEWVVWSDYRNGEDNPDIYAYNLSSGKERAICTAEGRQWAPDISGEWVVWEDYRHGEDNPDIYAYNLTSGKERAVCTVEGDQWSPAISGEWVVWEDWRHLVEFERKMDELGEDELLEPEEDDFRGTDIYAYNLRSREERVICAVDDSSEPATSGRWVVWIDLRNLMEPGGGTDIYAYNLSSGKERAITPHSAIQLAPAISGEWVVWEDHRDSPPNSDIYAYSLRSGEERVICAIEGSSELALSEEWVVWQDYRHGEDNPDIYAHNLSSGEEREICTAEGGQWAPDVSGGWVVWADQRNGTDNEDIYVHNLASGEERVVATAAGSQSPPGAPSD